MERRYCRRGVEKETKKRAHWSMCDRKAERDAVGEGTGQQEAQRGTHTTQYM